MDEQKECLYLEINIEPQDQGSVFVHSKHVPGLYLIGQNFQSMKAAVEKAIKRLFRDNDSLDVTLTWLTAPHEPQMTDVVARVMACPIKKAA